MAKLSDMLLSAMGWTNSHLHAFSADDKRYGMCFDDYPDGEIDEKTVTILQALRDTRRFTYEYDFGDSWEHDVTIEEHSRSHSDSSSPCASTAKNACPPEDVGGTWGYSDFLDAIAAPSHHEHERYLTWAGGSFDPSAFDLAEANALPQKVR